MPRHKHRFGSTTGVGAFTLRTLVRLVPLAPRFARDNRRIRISKDDCKRLIDPLRLCARSTPNQYNRLNHINILKLLMPYNVYRVIIGVLCAYDMHTLHIHKNVRRTRDRRGRVCVCIGLKNDLKRFVRMQRMSYSVPILCICAASCLSAFVVVVVAFLCLVCCMCQSRMETTPNNHGLVGSAAAAHCACNYTCTCVASSGSVHCVCCAAFRITI